MRFGITGQFRSTLARGTALLVLGGLAAGCSGGAAGLTDGLVTNSTTTSTPVVVAQANQPYPGDAQTGRRTQPVYEKIVRPREPVGGGMIQNAAPVELPPPASAQPVYSAPVNSGSTVSSSPLPPPQVPQNQRSAASVPAATPQPVNPDASSSASSRTAPQPQQPARQSSDQFAVLPQAPKPQQASRSDSEGSAANDRATVSGAYTVVSGDTLYGISRKTGASVESIKQANGLSSGVIRVGQKLTIPHGNAASETVVATTQPARTEPPKADPVTTASAKENTAPRSENGAEERKVSTYTPPSGDSVSEKAEEDVAALTPDSTGVGRLRWPARGRVVSAFGASSGDRGNDGIDIAVPEGTSVRAAENGVVIYSGDGLKGFGNTVLVRHEDGLVTVYGHASQLKVKRGDNVKRGQEIALSGMSGDADRPKLHFEVRKGTSPVDPMTYLE